MRHREREALTASVAALALLYFASALLANAGAIRGSSGVARAPPPAVSPAENSPRRPLNDRPRAKKKDSALKTKGRKIEWCAELKYKDGDDRDEKVALASFPGSGNTWVRYLLQQSTGLLTGSVYADATLRPAFPAERVSDSSVLVVKTHGADPEKLEKFDREILILRDPFDALLAEFNRRAGGHVGRAPASKFDDGGEWTSFVESAGARWEEDNLTWFAAFSPDANDSADADWSVMVVRYEDLVADTEAELRGMLDFLLGEGGTDEMLLSCAMDRKEGIYRREEAKEGSANALDFDPFTREMREALDERADRVYSAMGLDRPRKILE